MMDTIESVLVLRAHTYKMYNSEGKKMHSKNEIINRREDIVNLKRFLFFAFCLVDDHK